MFVFIRMMIIRQNLLKGTTMIFR